MRLEHFKYLLNREFDIFYFTETLVLYQKPFCLVDYETGENVRFATLDEALRYKLGEKTLAEYVTELDRPYMPMIDGGRGASSGRRLKFNHARREKDRSKDISPAYANVRIKSKTLSGALAEFKKNHLLANKEYVYAVDEDGYVQRYIAGNKSSVALPANVKVRRGEKVMIVHNHPSGGAFSDGDLLNTASLAYARGIIASGRNYDYTFTKGTHFKAQAFARAVRNARLSGADYDSAVNDWLKKNQKKYGYKYSRSKN